MSTYKKHLGVWVLFVTLGFLFGIGFLYISTWFEIPFFLNLLLPTLVLPRINCQNCGRSVVYQGKLGKIPLYGGWLNRKCRNCGWDLDKNENSGLET